MTDHIKQVTVSVTPEMPQPHKVVLKSLEGDLDVMVKDLNRHIAGAATKTGSETLENKTLTSPTISSPTIATPSVTGTLSSTGDAHFVSGTAVPTGGSTSVGIKATSTADLGVFFGAGAPTMTAAKGSLYLRTNGTTTNDRLYINTNGGIVWTAVSTVT